MSVFRYRDVPGMIGHLGTVFGRYGINISSAAVGSQPTGRGRAMAAMVVMTDQPVPDAVVAEVLARPSSSAGERDVE